MTTRTVDPADVIAEAGHELLVALAGLLEQHPDLRAEPDAVAGLLDQLSAMLRRARGQVRRVTRQDEPAVKPRPPAAAAELQQARADIARLGTELAATRQAGAELTAELEDTRRAAAEETARLTAALRAAEARAAAAGPTPSVAAVATAAVGVARPERRRPILAVVAVVAVLLAVLLLVAGCGQAPATRWSVGAAVRAVVQDRDPPVDQRPGIGGLAAGGVR